MSQLAAVVALKSQSRLLGVHVGVCRITIRLAALKLAIPVDAALESNGVSPNLTMGPAVRAAHAPEGLRGARLVGHVGILRRRGGNSSTPIDNSKSLVIYLTLMSPRRKIFTFAIDEDLQIGMKALKDRDGISESEQARRAIREFLLSRGIASGEGMAVWKKTAPRRAPTRRKA